MRRIVILVVCLLATPCWGQGALENPAPNSHQSGIGLISGWYCSANTIDAFIDGRILVPVAYGTPRGDTESTCGDTNNGFALLVNWAELGPGPHTLQLQADGVPFATVTVTVTTLGTAFLHGGSSTTTVTLDGQQVTLQWQESAQNFVITGVTRGSGGSQPSASVTPDSLSFDSVALNTCADRTLTVTNTGGGTLTGTASTALPFSITGGASIDLEAGQNRTLTVRFCPTTAGTRTGTLTLGLNSGDLTVSLTGSGSSQPTASVSPAALAFGDVVMNTCTERELTVTNTGGGMLIGSGFVAFSPFSVPGGVSINLGAGQSQAIPVQFCPITTGTSTGTLSLNLNAADIDVALTGSGIISSGGGGPGGDGGGCCRVCTTGQPCGNSCISRSLTCHQPPGCAC